MQQQNELFNRRLLLIATVAVSFLIAIVIEEVSALEESGWFNSRDFYKKVKNLDIFDDYPYEQSKLVVKVMHVSAQPIKRDFIIQYDKTTLFLDHKEFKKDSEAKVTFIIEDDSKKKVCMMSYADNYEKCKKFVYNGDKDAKITFYIN